MRETDDDIRHLAALIEHSNDSAGPFLKSSFEIPEKSLSAEQLVHRLDGVVPLAFGTVTSKGSPRVAPVVAIMYRGKFHIPTVRDALRTRHVLKNPEVSLTLYEGIDFAVIVHGKALVVGQDGPSFDELVEIQVAYSGSNVMDWGDAIFLKVEPSRLYTFARYPGRFEVESGRDQAS